MPTMGKAPSVLKQSTFDKLKKFAQGSENLHYNIFDLCTKVDRKHVLPLIAMRAFEDNHLHDLLNYDETMQNFLYEIRTTYRKEVPYHNDLHGADVMTMASHMI